MTVRELMERLNAMPPDMAVYSTRHCEDGDIDISAPVINVKPVVVHKKHGWADLDRGHIGAEYERRDAVVID